MKCYSCHTIPPALNKTGYMFKRLGYRLPPDEMDGTKPAPKITELDKNIKFSITNSCVIGQGSPKKKKGKAHPPPIQNLKKTFFGRGVAGAPPPLRG